MLWNFKMCLAELGLKQRDVAKMLGVSESMIAALPLPNG
jgi:DNA-binding XRE family transcriptional regulator